MPLPFFDRLSEIDEILRKEPYASDFTRQVRPLLEEEAALRYFYGHINASAWLDILDTAGEFSSPPEPQVDAVGKLVRYPAWPQGEYLKRMAPVVPVQVSAVILKIPRTTNYYVQSALVEAACVMPPRIAASLADVIARWIEHTDCLQFAGDYATLINHLAGGGEVEAAFSIAGALLEVFPNPRKDDRDVDSYGLGPLDEPIAKLDVWDYKEALAKVVSVLAQAAGMKALDLFNGLLKKAAELTQGVNEDGSLYDRYYVWPSAIEDHEQNQHQDSPKDLLVFAVRDVGEALIDEYGKAVLNAIEAHSFGAFKRIGLHLRQKWPNVDLSGTDALLRNPDIYRDHAFHHELFHLLLLVFGELSPETQVVFFDYVREGISLEVFQGNFRSWYRREPTPEETTRAARRHVFDKLIPVKNHLTGEWAAKWQELSQEFEIGEHPDFLSYFSVTDAPAEVPDNQPELASMSVQELTEYLRGYATSRDSQGKSLEGLGSQVGQLVKSDPEKYVSSTVMFQCLPPEIIREFLSAVRELVKNGQRFSAALWVPTLRLCQWVVDQPRDARLRRGEDADLDPGWGWTRKEIAQLLEEGLKSQSVSIPSALRESIWSVLRPLTDDPDPTQERDDASRPLDLSINTVRGWAMHAVVQYALWIRRKSDTQPEAEGQVACGFDVMPEVREVLDKHLYPDFDPSSGIRAVYGQWFPWLVVLDTRWAEGAKGHIFPRTTELRRLFDAAWETYIAFCNPYNNVFVVLQDEYAFAVQRIGTWSRDRKHFSDPDQCLAKHLMAYYWRGIIGLEDALIQGLYEKASDELRGCALDFIGGNLRVSPIQKQALSRLRALWERRLAAGKQLGQPESCRKELAVFGRWFASGVFDDKWSLEQLEEMLSLTSWAKPDHLVVEHLAKLSEHFPRQTLNCLSMMVEGDKDRWSIHAWRDSVRTILANALAAGDADTRQRATTLVHRLGSLGHLEYRDLLADKPGEIQAKIQEQTTE